MSERPEHSPVKNNPDENTPKVAYPLEGYDHDSAAKPKKSRFWRFVFWTLALFMVLFLAVILVVAISIRQLFFTPIQVENADPVHMVGWTLARDFSKEDPEIQRQLSDVFFKNILDGASRLDINNEGFQKAIPRIKETILQREEMLAHWEKSRPSDGSVKRLYKIAKTDAPAILSSDISPSDRLNEQLKALKDSGKTMVPAPQSKAEKNIRTMTRAWFLSKIAAYDAADDQKKPEVLTACVEDLFALQKIYANFREQVGLEPVEDLDRLRELNFTVASWYDDVPADELSRLLWFKDLLLSIIVAEQMGLPPKIDSMIFRSNEKEKGEKEKGGKSGGFLRRIL